ncbi:hypothetical protein CRX67_17010 [Enterobacteriaceae bacterium A-F18]|nr:hypothetical protein CRX67_17010 [Enterobacteriaceae bacterium A-F18]
MRAGALTPALSHREREKSGCSSIPSPTGRGRKVGADRSPLPRGEGEKQVQLDPLSHGAERSPVIWSVHHDHITVLFT